MEERYLIRRVGGEIRNGCYFSEDVEYDYKYEIDVDQELELARRDVKEALDGADAEIYELAPKECDSLDGWRALGGVLGRGEDYEFFVEIYERQE